MVITWNFYGEHFLRLNEDTEWHLYSDLDQYESPCLYLEVGDKNYILADGSEILSGREKMPICSYVVLDYYSGVIKDIAERLTLGTPKRIDMNSICEFVLRYEWWPKWLKAGLVTDDYWGREPQEAITS